MPSPRVAIVILNWNGKKYLEQFLPGVCSSTYENKEIIVADNASADDSISFVQSRFPQVRLIVFPKNLGFTSGYNEALKQVDADYYILLNSDVEVTPGWIAPMVALLEQDSSIAACQPKLLAYHQKNTFEYAGAAGGWMDRYGYPFCRGRVFDTCEADQGQYDTEVPVFWASGAALFIRAARYHEAGGFDNYFFAHMEEIDLCWRLQLAGHRVYACPQSVVYHVGGGTLSRSHPRKTYLNFRNNHIMLAKNLPFSLSWWIIPYRLCLDGVTAVKGLVSGNAGYFFAIIRAHFGFYKWLLLHRRKSVFPTDKKRKPAGLLHRNIVWLYFARGKKYFSEITGRAN